MTELHIPLIPTNSTFRYSNGRLHGANGDLLQLVVMPPDGVFLQTFRIKGLCEAPNSLLISLYRTPKDDFILPSADDLFKQSILGVGKLNQSIALAASGKNVVDNSIYNYGFEASCITTGPDDFVRIGEIALFY
jgi:hypothetical protein